MDLILNVVKQGRRASLPKKSSKPSDLLTSEINQAFMRKWWKNFVLEEATELEIGEN